MNNEKNKFLTVNWLSGLLSAEIFISTGFLRSGPQEATLVMLDSVKGEAPSDTIIVEI